MFCDHIVILALAVEADLGDPPIGHLRSTRTTALRQSVLNHFEKDCMSQTAPSTPYGDQDFRLIAARRLVCDKNAWQQPGYIVLVIHSLKQLMNDEGRARETLAEAAMLIRKLAASHNRDAS